MKIKLNQSYAYHNDIMKKLTMEFPELEIKVKERKWGLQKPSFKYKKNLYEFNHVDELMEQVRKIVRLKYGTYSKKVKNHGGDMDPEEEPYGDEAFTRKENN